MRGILFRSHPSGSQRLTGGERGDWWASYYCALGHRHRQKVGSRTLAAEEHGRLRRKVRLEGYCPDQAKRRKPVTIRDFSKRYLDQYAKASKRSWETDEYRLKPLLGALEDRFLTDVTPETIEKYRTARLGEKRSPSTVNREVALLGKMFACAVDWGLLERSPVARVKALQEPPGRVRYLLPQEITRLLAACPDHLRPIVVCALQTGMRKDEILGLTWDQVDLRARTIRLTRTKSGKARAIPINEALAAELGRLRRIGPEPLYVFVNPESDTRYVDVKKAWKAALVTAKISSFRFHDLRHTAATYLQAATGDLLITQKVLGHADVRMTTKYAHVSDERLRQAIADLQVALSG
jgi:integrase